MSERPRAATRSWVLCALASLGGRSMAAEAPPGAASPSQAPRIDQALVTAHVQRFWDAVARDDIALAKSYCIDPLAEELAAHAWLADLSARLHDRAPAKPDPAGAAARPFAIVRIERADVLSMDCTIHILPVLRAHGRAAGADYVIDLDASSLQVVRFCDDPPEKPAPR
jgi:hypothetical protein